MRYAEIKHNDIANGKGLCVSFWCQGCPHRCPGCHNKETWDFNGGHKYTKETLSEVIEAIGTNGIKRNLSILGGEPLVLSNHAMVFDVVSKVRKQYPSIKIYMWTGYKYEDVINQPTAKLILEEIDYLIDGEFIEDLKDLNINYAGSSNQRIIDVQSSLKIDSIVTLDNF